MITDIPRCTKVCAVTGQEITPGQTVFSMLWEDDGVYRRADYSQDGWKNRPKEAETTDTVLGWWKHKVPIINDKKAKLAPNDILLALFDQLTEQPEKMEMRYVLTLLLVRRRIFRLEKEEKSEIEGAWGKIVVYNPKADATYEVLVAVPESERIEEIQNELAALVMN